MTCLQLALRRIRQTNKLYISISLTFLDSAICCDVVTTSSFVMLTITEEYNITFVLLKHVMLSASVSNQNVLT